MSEQVASITREYYDSQEADNFYYDIWGGENIHVGIYHSSDDPILEASQRIIAKMAEMIKLNKDTSVADIGSGYGGAARYLAKHYGCRVTCGNISSTENERAREKNRQQGVDHLIDVHEENFEKLSFADDSFDVVWSADAILHSGNKYKVFCEAYRILKPGGQFIFTDPMQSDDCPAGVLQPVLDRIHLDSLGSFALYRKYAQQVGLQEVEIVEMTDNLITHYQRVHDELIKRYDEMTQKCTKEYVDRMLKGLRHWVEAGKNGHLAWGILHFRK